MAAATPSVTTDTVATLRIRAWDRRRRLGALNLLVIRCTIRPDSFRCPFLQLSRPGGGDVNGQGPNFRGNHSRCQAAAWGTGGIQGSSLKSRTRASRAPMSFLRMVER